MFFLEIYEIFSNTYTRSRKTRCKPPDEDRIELVHADDVEDRKAEGWKEPEGMKANGEEWNREDDLPGQDIAATLQSKLRS
ncbi:hypothetical protein [Xanthomonas oryzae]|uniref:hypothetical protein n=1 Tax=Xanthomonas oryzae TaxID=347 RepID=UPI0010585CC6|nr:hypothetical protein [Xanthomonas oryzae]